MFGWYNQSYAMAQSLLGLDLDGEHGQGAIGTILTLVVAGISLVIGIYVFAEVESNIPRENNSAVENIVNDLYKNVKSRFGEGAYGIGLSNCLSHRIDAHSLNRSCSGGYHSRASPIPII